MKPCSMCPNQTDDNARYCHDCQQSIKGAFYLLDALNGREGNPEGREAVREILQTAVNNGNSLTIFDDESALIIGPSEPQNT